MDREEAGRGWGAAGACSAERREAGVTPRADGGVRSRLRRLLALSSWSKAARVVHACPCQGPCRRLTCLHRRPWGHTVFCAQVQGKLRPRCAGASPGPQTLRGGTQTDLASWGGARTTSLPRAF